MTGLAAAKRTLNPCLIASFGLVLVIGIQFAAPAGAPGQVVRASGDGYPRIVNIWGGYDPTLGPAFFARYEMFIPSRGGSPIPAEAIRAINPSIKILRLQNATYGPPEDPQTKLWLAAHYGEPGYACLLRDSTGEILFTRGNPMYNMTNRACRDVLVQQNEADWRANGGGYDGVFWDKLYDAGPYDQIGDDIDADLDWRLDDHATLDAAYKAGVVDYLTQMRAALSGIVMVGNDASKSYDTWLNGRYCEWELGNILDGASDPNWYEAMDYYRDWSGRGRSPHTTFIGSAAEGLYAEKYEDAGLDEIPPAMAAEAASGYQRMRYGLTTALMGDGMFSYDLGGFHHGSPWWYDEFGVPGGTLGVGPPAPGYLGYPTGAARLLVDTLDTPDQITNGGFDNGLQGWRRWFNPPAAATFTVDATDETGGTSSAHVAVTRAAGNGDVELSQLGKVLVAGRSYTLSFWASSSAARTVWAKISKETSPYTPYGFSVPVTVIPQWQHFHLWDQATVTGSDGLLMFLTGDAVGDLWLDDVQLQSEALGVWARPFSNGLAVLNTTKEVQSVPLPDTYCKLNSGQAPLFQARVDDDAAQASSGWSRLDANYSQFGLTVHTASGGSSNKMTYTPDLAYSGTYTVMAWVVPATGQSRTVQVTIHHAQGQTTVQMDETTGSVGWRSLGTYSFNGATDGSAVLSATGTGKVVADAFKWVSTARYNDGARVSQVRLQPQDGIILLTCGFPPGDPAEFIHLPLIMRDWVSGQ